MEEARGDGPVFASEPRAACAARVNGLLAQGVTEMSSKLTKAKATIKALVRAGHRVEDVLQRVVSGFRLTDAERSELEQHAHSIRADK